MKQLFQNIVMIFSSSAVVCGVLLSNISAGICFGIAASIIYTLITAKGITESDFS